LSYKYIINEKNISDNEYFENLIILKEFEILEKRINLKNNITLESPLLGVRGFYLG
jgi:hypothetical protein